MDNNNTMKNKKIGLVLAVAFVIVVIAVGIFALVGRKDSAPASSATEIRVAITENGFSPATVSVNRGTTVVWENNTAEPRKVGANPYPDASSLPDLKSEAIAPGDSYAYTFDENGTFGYADYTKPTTTGTIQVR